MWSFEFLPTYDLLSAPDHDPGLYSKARGYAQGARNSHSRLVIALDAEWQGSPGAAKISEHISRECQHAGWNLDDVCVVVLDPEIENWIWQDNANVEAELGHRGPESLRSTLAGAGDWPLGAAKPPRPKETLEALLRRHQIPRSSGIYRRIAARVSVKSCTDPAFNGLVAALRRWFPP